MKYLQTYRTVIVYVKHPENLLEVLLWTPVGHDIQNNHEFPEVDMTVLGGSYFVTSNLSRPCSLQLTPTIFAKNRLNYIMLRICITQDVFFNPPPQSKYGKPANLGGGGALKTTPYKSILRLSPRLYHTFWICDAQAFRCQSQGSIPIKKKINQAVASERYSCQTLHIYRNHLN